MDDAALLLRRRTLLERFHIPVWELDDVPADFIDQLMLTLQVEQQMLEDMRRSA